jgi:hypothetical protein
MTMRAMPRKAVDSWLWLTLLPLDAGAKIVNGRNPTLSTGLDRADATFRSIVARMLRDEELQADADRRLAAADERARAFRLRVEAEQRAKDADEHFSQRLDRAEHERQRVEERAGSARQAADEGAEKQRREAAERESRKRSVTSRAAAQKKQAAKERSDRARLDELEKETQALDRAREALHTEQKATRLADAAAAKKAARKSR